MVGGSFANHPSKVPDPQWKKWTRDKLPSSKSFWITDIDSFFRTRMGCVTLVEIKRYEKQMESWQKMSYGFIAGALKRCENTTIEHPLLEFPLPIKHFNGFIELVFERTWFNDGWFKVYHDGASLEGMTEAGLIQIEEVKCAQ